MQHRACFVICEWNVSSYGNGLVTSYLHRSVLPVLKYTMTWNFSSLSNSSYIASLKLCLPFVYIAYNFINCLCLYCHFLCVIGECYCTETIVAGLFVSLLGLCARCCWECWALHSQYSSVLLELKRDITNLCNLSAKIFFSSYCAKSIVICFFHHSHLF